MAFQKIFIGILGFAGLIIVNRIYNYIERNVGGIEAVIASIPLLVIVGVAWRYAIARAAPK